jgi:hypothetical protein
MPRVVQLLWRVDYNFAYNLLDKRGSVLRALFTEVAGFWQNAGTGQLPDSLMASSLLGSPDNRIISVEPTSCNGSLGWSTGYELSRVISNESFRNLSRILEKVFSLCDIRAVNRAGIRFIIVGEAISSSLGFRGAFPKETSNAFSRGAESALGAITDSAIILEGTHKDGVGYRIQLGPTEERNILAWNSTADVGVLMEYPIFVDVDLFEFNFSFREHSLQKWATTKLDKVIGLMELYHLAPDIR